MNALAEHLKTPTAFRNWLEKNADKGFDGKPLYWNTQNPLARFMQALSEYPMISTGAPRDIDRRNGDPFGVVRCRSYGSDFPLPLWATAFQRDAYKLVGGWTGKQALQVLDETLKRVGSTML